MIQFRLRLGLAAFAASLLPMLARAQPVTVGENEVIAPLAGRMYTPPTFLPPSNFGGTDLGFTFKHEGQLAILFGDTWSNVYDLAKLGEIDGKNDDVSGIICLQQGPGPCAQGGIANGAVAKWYAVFGPRRPGALDITWDRFGPPVNFFVEPLLRTWVMIYGGDVFPTTDADSRKPLETLYGIDDRSKLTLNPAVAVSLRTADMPWGPWSAPINLFPNPSNVSDPGGPGYLDDSLRQIAPGGVLRSPLCVSTSSTDCVPHEDRAPANGFGSLYGANIIDAWTVDATTTVNGVQQRAADIYWNVSTGDPYQVLLMRSRLKR
jgi:hypothetical protein